MSAWEWAAVLAWPAAITGVIAFFHWAGKRRAQGDQQATEEYEAVYDWDLAFIRNFGERKP